MRWLRPHRGPKPGATGVVPHDASATSRVEARVRPFAELQRRIGRKTLGPKILREIPVVLLAYDLLEWQGRDLRVLPQFKRRELLDHLLADLAHPQLLPSPVLAGARWTELAKQREAARSLGVEGMMLKRRDAHYGVGRTKDVGVWWKWKIDPLIIDAVLIYAQRGHGRRASVYSDYTFAVWDGPQDQADRKLVPFAKAYSGLTDKEMARVDAVIRKTTIESFGPCAASNPPSYSNSASKASRAARDTKAASRCASRACCAGARTSRWRRRIRWRRWGRYCHGDAKCASVRRISKRAQITRSQCEAGPKRFALQRRGRAAFDLCVPARNLAVPCRVQRHVGAQAGDNAIQQVRAFRRRELQHFGFDGFKRTRHSQSTPPT